MTVPYIAPTPQEHLRGSFPFPWFYTVQYTVQYTLIIYTEDNNENAIEQIGEMITLESFASQYSHYKLRYLYQCENIISSAFTLLPSNNLLLIQNLSKFRRWVARVPRGGKGAAPLPHRWLRPWLKKYRYFHIFLKHNKKFQWNLLNKLKFNCKNCANIL